MTERLVLEIEVPGFNVEGIVASTIELTEATSEDDILREVEEQIEISMGLGDDAVILVFIVADDNHRTMQPMNGRIIGRKIVQDGHD